MLVNLDEEQVLDALMERVRHWTEGDSKVEDLYHKMYENYVYGGVFSDSEEFDVMSIVDNDYINWCSVVYDDENAFAKLKEVYEQQGLGDCSCEDCDGNYIEAVDREDEPTMFLIR